MKPAEPFSRKRSLNKEDRFEGLSHELQAHDIRGKCQFESAGRPLQNQVANHDLEFASPETKTVLWENQAAPVDSNYRLNYSWLRQVNRKTCPLRWVAWNTIHNWHEFYYCEELVLRIIKKLSSLLPTVKSFRSNDFDGLSDTSNPFRSRVPKKVEFPETPISLEINKLTTEEMYELYTKDKTTSMSVQYFILKASDKEVKALARLTAPLISSLVCHQYGNYCIQKLIARDQKFTNWVDKYCTESLRYLTFNEYGSRTMQILVESSDHFRKLFLSHAAGDTRSITKRISYVFLVTSAINCSKSEEEILPLLKEFIIDYVRWLAKKYLKRVLVSIIQRCNNDQNLSIIFDLYNHDRPFAEQFKDRYRVYIAIAFVKKEFKPALEVLRSSFQDAELFLLPGYFKLFCDIIFRSRLISVLRLINERLLDSDLYKLGQWRSSGLKLKVAYLLALTSPPDIFCQHTLLWKDLNAL